LKEINIDLAKDKYSIYIERGLIDNISYFIKGINRGKKIALIIDENVDNLYGCKIRTHLIDNGFSVKTISIRGGEGSKSLRILDSIYRKLLDFNITRGDLIIVMGGGVAGDVGGFAAATYLRGMDFIHIPTTLLAQIDSSIGGKVAVNLPEGKNLVGSFYQPKGVFIDPNLLCTLDTREFNNGMAEAIKYACIADKNLFHQLLMLSKEEIDREIEDIIFTCCNIKGKIVMEDEKDRGNRMLLNFGHTIGHVIEKYFNYEKYTHGEAIAIGMYNITLKSEIAGYTKEGITHQIKEVLEKFGLPYRLPDMDRGEILKTLALDKKSKGNNIDIILIKDIGEGIIKNLSRKIFFKEFFPHKTKSGGAI